jgi:type IV pilus assembly protein PilE
MMKKYNGFTLIEIMMVTALVAILAVTSIQLFTWQARKARRADGINTLMAMSLAQERYRTNNTTYGTLAQTWGGVSTSTGGYYTLTVTNVSATGYTLNATAIGDQANDRVNGTTCSPLVLAVSNGTVTQTPTVCWPS